MTAEELLGHFKKWHFLPGAGKMIAWLQRLDPKTKVVLSADPAGAATVREMIYAAFAQCRTPAELIQQGERMRAAVRCERHLHHSNRRWRKKHGHERPQLSLELDQYAH